MLRSSRRLALLFSWMHGTRLRVRGRGHLVRRHDSILRRTRVEILGTGCRLTIGPRARLWDCSITLGGENAELVIGADCQLRGARLCVEDRCSRLLIGAGTTVIGATLLSQEGRLVQLGEDCLVAEHANVRNSDSHAIRDRQGARLNPAGDVILGHHVWIGLNACIFKGAVIGDGAVVGANSLVTGPIPPACLAFGAPATVRRNAILWGHDRGAGPSAS